MMLFRWEKDDDVIPAGEGKGCDSGGRRMNIYSGGRRMIMLFQWEKDDNVILV